VETALRENAIVISKQVGKYTDELDCGLVVLYNYQNGPGVKSSTII